MEKIIITIPDNLSPQEELLIIAKNLNKKLLPSAKNNKILGNGYVVKNLETQITIKREEVQKPIITMVCSVCETIYESIIAKKLWVNYGGKPKQRCYCSDKYTQFVIDFAGAGRAAISKKDLRSHLAY